jgi:hypothetical protein
MSFSATVQPILTAKCAGCHGTGGTPPNLSAGNAYAATVNVAAGMCATTSYVVPGNAAASFLVAALTANSMVGTCSGGFMASYDATAAADAATISTWINEGAPNN